jgi:hypothetical protein
MAAGIEERAGRGTAVRGAEEERVRSPHLRRKEGERESTRERRGVYEFWK